MHESDSTFALLHALSLRGMTSRETLASIAGPVLVDDRLPILLEAGLVRELTGRIAGLTLTKIGRAEHATLLAVDRESGGLTEALRAPYAQFLAVNQPFIGLYSAWQVRRDTDEPNDHDDQAYDDGILFELERVHRAEADVGAAVAEIADRFASYGPRFDVAIGRVRAGDVEWFTKPTIESYHTVWFELHENLLVSRAESSAQRGVDVDAAAATVRRTDPSAG